MAEKVGFIGLGMMGNPMSKNLLKAGFSLTVWNRTASKMKELTDLGAKGASSPKEVAENSDVVITMLTSGSDVKEVALGKGGVMEGAKPGLILIDMSTVSPKDSQEIAREVEKKGCEMLDAPVSGSVGVAARGALTIQVGGKKEVFERAVPILKGMGQNIFHIGPSGMGSNMKLVTNTIMGCNAAALCEGLAMGTKAGIPPETMVEVLKFGGGQSRVLELRGPKIIAGDFSPSFMLKLLDKDMGLALENAQNLKVPVSIAEMIRGFYKKAIENGKGDNDFNAIATVFEDMAGVQIRKKG